LFPFQKFDVLKVFFKLEIRKKVTTPIV
jgi:hypothetical protein